MCNIHLVIHNNGPKNIIIESDFELLLLKRKISFLLDNCLDNKPLSNLYNDFIEANRDFNKFVILDDDSTVTQSFIDAMNFDDYDLEIPKIISRDDKKIYYPLHNNQVVSCDGFLDVIGTHSIGSGLIFTKEFVKKFERNSLKLFDEHYVLYGVDVSLFRRMWYLNNLCESFKVKTSSVLMHSLSRVEGPENQFRRTERLIDFAVSVRRYPTFRAYAAFFKKGMKQLLKLQFKDFLLMCSSFISGAHPRSKLWDK